ncbi:MAG: succinate dehydrogenase/fumarate reductase flavoprotein subunit, partial [Candidatus Delongbacteria bacterium]|nr:succinate dehydrogenase/fumarate reductase flavoprotein subunit [Candidatus Delongbacteria bacterium]
MYPEYMQESIKKVESTRPDRLDIARRLGKMIYPGMNEEERKDVLNENHPDYKADARREVNVGPDKGQILTTEIAEMLETYSRIDVK